MSADGASRAAAGTAMASWSLKALLIAAGVFLVGGAIWYARGATVPLIVAALISTQLLPLIELAARRGMSRGLAVAASLLSVIVIGVGFAWVFTHALFGNLGGVGEDISEGADKVVAWLGDNNDWVEQHEDAIHDFLKSILPAAKEAAGGVLEGALGALSLTAQLISGALLVLVFLLYLLTGGDAIWGGVRDRFSPDRRDRVAGVGRAAWNAASGYIRGISLIALIDTTVITLGMLVIGTPHVGTLALLMFVTPLVYQQTVNLHPIVTLTAVIVGSQLLGIVGAFLAVPMVAVGWSIYKTLEQRDPESVSAVTP